MAAEELLTKALLSMKRGDCLSHTSQLLHGALALSPTKAEASYWHAMLLEQMYEEKQALECLEQALALRPTKTWRKKLMAELPSLSILICLCAGAEDGLCLLFGNHNHTTESFEEMW